MSVPLRTFECLERQLDIAIGVDAGMSALFDACESEAPHLDWQRLRALDFEAGARDLESWLDDIFEVSPPREADGLWFGLFTAVYDDDEPRADVYVHGSRFDPIDEYPAVAT